MTIAEMFKPDGSADEMIDTLYDLLIAARIPFGVAELQDGKQLFVLPQGHRVSVTKEDVMYELAAYLAGENMSMSKMGMELQNAIIDIV